MTTKKYLIAASALALIASGPALAEVKTSAEVNANTSTPSVKEDIKKGWENTKEAVSKAADKTSRAAEDAYENIKATMISKEETTTRGATVTIDSRTTASGIIGKPVLNSKGEKIASVKDIILDGNGDAQLIVVADGGFAGIGTKLAAFDYGLVSQRNQDGDVMMPISEETLAKVAAFSYEVKDAKDNVRVIPANGISAAKLLDGQVLNTKKENVAEIDNISLRGGKAGQVIVAFDQTLGMGGEKAAMNFSDVKIVRENDDLDIQLSAAQSANFENYKKTTTN